jgi:SWI/SNF-related matrix-associated actin-dependent regulator of chromatin subfamily A member 5
MKASSCQRIDWDRITERIEEGESKRNRQVILERLLHQKINSVRYPMQELDLNYPSTKGKIYSEEEDRYLLVRLAYYGLGADDVYERIKKDITEFPVFRFDWFFKSRTPQELSRRANTLLGMIAKEEEERGSERGGDIIYEEAHAEPVKKSKVNTYRTSSTLAKFNCRSVPSMSFKRVRKRHAHPPPRLLQKRRRRPPLRSRKSPPRDYCH